MSTPPKKETPTQREARRIRQRAYHKAWRELNQVKLREYNEAYWAKSKDQRKHSTRAYTIRTKFGLSMQEYDELREGQGCRCKICGTDKARVRHHDYAWYVDHDHVTGKVRGLLCHNCNIAMGLLKENIETLQSTITYLGK